MPRQPTLRCKLARHVVTDEGDFVPKGTPCVVLCWDRDESPTELFVKALVAVSHQDKLDDDLTKENRAQPDFYLTVRPEDLEFLAYD